FAGIGISEARCNGGRMMMIWIPVRTAAAGRAATTVIIGLGVTEAKMTGPAGAGGGGGGAARRGVAAAGATAMITTSPAHAAGTRGTAAVGATAMITAPAGAAGTRGTA